MLKQTVGWSEFLQGFNGDEFSYEGLKALFEYYDEIGEDIEFDPVAIRCEWSEYDSIAEALEQYGDEYQTFQDLSDATTVLETEGFSVVVLDF